MRIPILIALLLSACSYDGIEVRRDGEVLDVLHTAVCARGPGYRCGVESDITGDRLRLRTEADPGNGGEGHVRLTLRHLDGSECDQATVGPRLGDGLWMTQEGVEIGVVSGPWEIEGQLTWVLGD